MPLRIIAGEYRRRKLRTNPGQTTRPITDRMKEKLFEQIGEFKGARVADVFAGTGTLGLECLSRGAASAVFFEFDRKAFGLLRENVESVGVGDRGLCWRVDVSRTSFKPKGVEGFHPYTLVFFDPPYKIATDFSDSQPLGKSLKRLAHPNVTADDALMVLRSPNEYPVVLPSAWEEVERLRVSSSRLSLCRKISGEVD